MRDSWIKNSHAGCDTVIEVGIDVANASIMVIEHSERFGLSQLHQLRGRVGEGQIVALLLVIPAESSLTEEAKMRIDAMIATDNVFKIAVTDLKIRGPGELPAQGNPFANIPESESIAGSKFLKSPERRLFSTSIRIAEPRSAKKLFQNIGTTASA